MTFQYKKLRRSKEPSLPRPIIYAEPKQAYTGLVMGSRASHGEENFYNAIMKTGRVSYVWFRFAIGAPIHYPGQKELDFLILTTSGVYIAIQVRDYDYIHKGEEMRAKDLASDVFILEELKKDGIEILDNEIKTIDDDELETLEEAKRVAERMLI